MSFGMISAKTVVSGKIYNADYTQGISEANVTIDCNSQIQYTLSREDGSYNVEYTEHECDDGDDLIVSAVKGDLYGSNTGIIYNDVLSNKWDLAIVNVPLVPEFGLIAGITTLIGAFGIFIYIRKR
jgi:hypothetical protein